MWPFDQIGNNSSTPQTVDVLSKLADGNTHTLRYSMDPKTGKPTGSPQDLGVETAAPGKAPAKPVIQKLTDGSTWAFSFNPDGSVKERTQLADAGGKPVDPALEGQRDANTRLIDQKLADAEAIAPYNLDKAKAVIDNLNARTDLIPAQKDLINARVSRIASQNSVDPSRIGLNNANAGKALSAAGLSDAKTQAMLQGTFFKLTGEYKAIDDSIGKPGGPATQQEADALKQQIFDQAAHDAATGITSYQQAQLANTAASSAVSQGNNRATNAATTFDGALRTVGDIATKGAAPGQGGMLTNGFLALMNAANQNQTAMGGAPVNVPNLPPGAQQPVSDAHKQEIAQLVASGQAPADANGNRFPAAVKMVAAKYGIAGQPGADAGADGLAATQPTPSTQSFLQNVNVGNSPTLAAASSGGM